MAAQKLIKKPASTPLSWITSCDQAPRIQALRFRALESTSFIAGE
jgi:hypothetical protein